jgi:hypothetical protein
VQDVGALQTGGDGVAGEEGAGGHVEEVEGEEEVRQPRVVDLYVMLYHYCIILCA